MLFQDHFCILFHLISVGGQLSLQSRNVGFTFRVNQKNPARNLISHLIIALLREGEYILDDGREVVVVQVDSFSHF